MKWLPLGTIHYPGGGDHHYSAQEYPFIFKNLPFCVHIFALNMLECLCTIDSGMSQHIPDEIMFLSLKIHFFNKFNNYNLTHEAYITQHIYWNTKS